MNNNRFHTTNIVNGFTIIELMIILSVVGLLAMVALPAYDDYRERVDINSAATDISVIGMALDDYNLSNGSLPASLADIGMGSKNDPFGNPYQYINHDTAPPGHRRKDKNLVPINSDYDLYSMGEDGNSVAPLTAQSSKDDIIRANNGSYIGKAEDY